MQKSRDEEEPPSENDRRDEPVVGSAKKACFLRFIRVNKIEEPWRKMKVSYAQEN